MQRNHSVQPAASDETSVSIFGLLTARNPNVKNQEVKDKTQTYGNWHIPKKLQRWTEFSFSTLRQAYNGQLLNAAKRESSRPFRHPHSIGDEDLFVCDEVGTANVYTLWNRIIVNDALHAVQEDFNSTIWMQSKPKTTPGSPARASSPSLGARRNPAREAKRTDSPSGSKVKRMYPDGGAVPHSTISPDEPPPTDMERLPKDYKTFSKWKCADLERILGPTEGVVTQGLRRNRTLSPILQIFSYCVDLKCRYGCLLTTGEAIIIRVRRQRKATANARAANVSTFLHLIAENPRLGDALRGVFEDGIVEYMPIPWDNHCGGDLDGYESWTVNLALWFVHILAGNEHQIGWEYLPLQDEALRPQAQYTSSHAPAADVPGGTKTFASIVEQAGSTRPNESFSSLGKRKRDTTGDITDHDEESTNSSGDEVSDTVHHSFNAESCLGHRTRGRNRRPAPR